MIALYPKIVSIDVNPSEYCLKVKFDNGQEVLFDVKKKLNEPGFELLEDKTFFKTVRIDAGGYGISWNDEIDISEYEIWTTGKRVGE